MLRDKGNLFLTNNTGLQVNGLNFSVSSSDKLTSVVSRSYSASHFIMMSAIHTQTSVNSTRRFNFIKVMQRADVKAQRTLKFFKFKLLNR
jgi:hypothetical protein